MLVDLYRFYHAGDDETLALRGVSIAVGEGETVAVAGLVVIAERRAIDQFALERGEKLSLIALS